MWMKRVLALAVIAVTSSAHAFEMYKGEEFTAQMKGYMEINGLYSDSETSLQDGSSRLGFQFDYAVTQEWNVGAYLEWAIRTTSSGKDLRISGDDQPSLSSGDPDDTISLRQGNIYLNNDKWGDFKVGKQWSVYYDASGSTDVFNIYGGQGSGTFNLGSDGGLSGTGRADNAVTWRRSYSSFDIGLQTQFSPGEIDVSNLDLANDEIVEGDFDSSYSASLGYTFDVGMPLSVRGAYNYALIELAGRFEGEDLNDVHDEAWVVSLTLGDAIFTKGIYASILYAKSHNHDFDKQGILYGGKGLETVIGYGFNDEFQIYAGNNLLKVDDSDYSREIDDYLDANPDAAPLTDKHELSYFIVGANYNWAKRINVFVELRIDDSDFNGRDGEDIYGVGIRLRL